MAVLPLGDEDDGPMDDDKHQRDQKPRRLRLMPSRTQLAHMVNDNRQQCGKISDPLVNRFNFSANAPVIWDRVRKAGVDEDRRNDRQRRNQDDDLMIRHGFFRLFHRVFSFML